MARKIYEVSYCSYTEENIYLYHTSAMFGTKKKAQEWFNKRLEEARFEAIWGSQTDLIERDEELKYDIDETNGDGYYSVNSNAYGRFFAIVEMAERNVN